MVKEDIKSLRSWKAEEEQDLDASKRRLGGGIEEAEEVSLSKANAIFSSLNSYCHS